MRIILSLIIVLLNIQSLTKADDIRQIEIEGMSIGDSLLDFFSQEEIKNNKLDWYKSDRYITIKMIKNYDVYDHLQISFLKNDFKKKNFCN